jgi:hypothetical protein
MSDAAQLDAEDAKLVTLALAARARTGVPEGAAVRDDAGRTYTAATVDLPSLSLSALQAAVAVAVGSGSRGVEAAAVVTEASDAAASDLAVLRDLGGPGVRLLLADPGGRLRARIGER